MIEAPSDVPAADLVRAARRITIKVGSSLLIAGDGVRRDWMASLADDIAALLGGGQRGGGRQVAVVSSGAVALGRAHLKLGPSSRLDVK